MNCIFYHDFREEYLKVVTVPIDSTISLLTRIMSVTSDSLVSLTNVPLGEAMFY